MLLRREELARYTPWNRRWGAPHGRWPRRVLPPSVCALPGLAQWVGPFAFQPNNDTRALEYPWAFEMLDVKPGLRILEIGGSNSGLQFVLARAGAELVNVDPGEAARGVGWPVTEKFTARLNRRFGCNVRLLKCFLEDAALPDASFDRALSVSTFEHIPEAELPGVLAQVRRVLKPGGYLVMTVDLFLDLAPFTGVATNRWGTNLSIRWLVEQSGLELVLGRPEELFGYSAFDPERVRAQSDMFYVGRNWPVMVQALILRKPAEV